MRASCAVVVFALSGIGCGRVAYDSAPGADSDGSIDARLAIDATASPDSARGLDARSALDGLAGEADATAAPLRCPDPQSDAVALYRFEAAAPMVDEMGVHDAMTSGGTLGSTTGPNDCGGALAFPADGNAFLWIADSPDWDLPDGSVDFWVRFDVDASAGFVALVTRDAGGNADGHFSVFRVQDGTIVARLQTVVETVHLCANTPTPEEAWTHVGVNFGAAGFELWVNGQRATRTDEVVFESPTFARTVWPCGGSLTIGLAGNDNPWILGVNGARTDEGALTPIAGEWLREGAIDHFRVSRVRRDFRAYTDL